MTRAALVLVIAIVGMASVGAMPEPPAAVLQPGMLISEQECRPDCPCEQPNDPSIGVVLTGRRETGTNTFTGGDIGDLEYPSTFINDIGTQIGTDTQGGVQRLVIEFEPAVVPPSPTTRERVADDPPPVWRRLIDVLAGPVLHAQVPRDALTLMFTANGNSQGQAFDLKLINRGTRAVRFAGEGLVVEPLRKEAIQAAQREFTKLARGFTTARINGYCLDQPLPPPSAGTMFRLAPANVQKQFASVKHLLQGARKLNSEGLLRPDSNPTAYLDFIKQWSVWTEREKWNQSAFVDKWIEHTRKQAAGVGRTLTGADEKTLRSAAPNRWRDISAVIAEAAKRR